MLAVNLVSIFTVSLYPLLVNHRYELNLYVVWAGAFRLAEGQLPYMDFGIPMGVGFFLIPALFFKLFSPQFFTLIWAQLFINLVFFWTFYKLLSAFSLPKMAISLGILALTIIYIPLNYWPWYNNSVIVYEFLGIYLLVYGLMVSGQITKQLIYVILSAFIVFITFMTKQDAGSMTILISGIILLFHAIIYRNYYLLPIFLIVSIGTIALYFVYFENYDIHYWFNYGQAPHFSRLNLHDLLKDFILDSKWEKLYLAVGIIFFGALIAKNIKSLLSVDYFKRNLYLLLTIAVLFEAIVFQVTSYNPAHSNIFYHAFGISLFIFIAYEFGVRFTNGHFLLLCILILFIFSDNTWNRASGFFTKFFPVLMEPPPKTAVSTDNFWAIDTVSRKPESFTTTSEFKTLKRMIIPVDALEGIKRIKQLDIIKNNPKARILNMSELTFLEYELGVEMLHGSDHPLWFHVGVCMFDREINHFKNEVNNKRYDLIVFQVVPYWKDYFPNVIREEIQKNYQMIDRFFDIKGSPNTYVEVYARK